MRTNKTKNTEVVGIDQLKKEVGDRGPGSLGLLKVAIDVHGEFDVWMAQQDNAAPRGAQKGDRKALINYLKGQRAKGWNVISCYEAGPFGYGLHRELVEAGIDNRVIRPRNWDDSRRRVRTDRTDTRSMLVALDRFVAGQVHALDVVRVPSPEAELRRQRGRVAQQLKREGQRIAQMGRSQALYFGHRMVGAWYSERRWPRWKKDLPEWLVSLLEPLRAVLMKLVEEYKALRAQLLEQSPTPESLPEGMGLETADALEREICDWNRFSNRRAVGGFAGMTPGEASSGASRQQGGISKCGNGRIRWLLVQMAWRLPRFQPDYVRVKRFRERCGPGANSARRRKAVVALAREFLVDWWRIRTGRVAPEKLGLKMRQTSQS